MKGESVLVVFGEEFPRGFLRSGHQYDIVVAPKKLQPQIQAAGLEWVDIGGLTGPGSIYEASAYLEELSRITLGDGSRLSKYFLYKGYELWWMHYDNLFHFFCLPYTQYRELLQYLKDFSDVALYEPPASNLFRYFLSAHGSRYKIVGKVSREFPAVGVWVQAVLSIPFFVWLCLKRPKLMVWTSDLLDPASNCDFRMRFIYEELRKKRIRFFECIRSMESTHGVVRNAFKRRRPVIYSYAMASILRTVAVWVGPDRRIKTLRRPESPEQTFRFLVATHYLRNVRGDIWAIRVMRFLLRGIGVRSAIIDSASGRNFHEVLGCKLAGIPITGILHGVGSRHYNVTDFMPGYDGEKTLSVDRYGLWSEWWRAHYIEHSKAYKPEQLYVSGPIRPLLKNADSSAREEQASALRVLFVSEEMAVPQEVLPYLRGLLRQADIELTLKFRPYRDKFEQWLLRHEPDILTRGNLRIIKGSMQDAIENADVAIGCQSTGVLETLLQLKVPVFFRTKKWGDYFNIKDYDENHSFFAENLEELVEKIKGAKFVPPKALKDLQERYFGDPRQNGSKWVVEQAEKFLGL